MNKVGGIACLYVCKLDDVANVALCGINENTINEKKEGFIFVGLQRYRNSERDDNLNESGSDSRKKGCKMKRHSDIVFYSDSSSWP